MNNKEYREVMIAECKALLKEPTRFNIRRLIALAQCLEDLEKCSYMEIEESRISEKRAKR